MAFLSDDFLSDFFDVLDSLSLNFRNIFKVITGQNNLYWSNIIYIILLTIILELLFEIIFNFILSIQGKEPKKLILYRFIPTELHSRNYKLYDSKLKNKHKKKNFMGLDYYRNKPVFFNDLKTYNVSLSSKNYKIFDKKNISRFELISFRLYQLKYFFIFYKKYNLLRKNPIKLTQEEKDSIYLKYKEDRLRKAVLKSVSKRK